MINLIQNAIEACNGYIEITSEIRDGSVRLKFLNNGELITEEVEEKIFSPFFTTKVSGTGLGLPITKKIIEEEHNGKLTIERAVKGESEHTVFVIEIPVKLSEQEE
jgi:two-component system sensor kinase